jgi:hypothetical protein
MVISSTHSNLNSVVNFFIFTSLVFVMIPPTKCLEKLDHYNYLRWYNQDQTKAIVADYVEGKITMLKAGVVPDVLFVEGCA